MATTAQDLIDSSVSHTEIARAKYTAELAADLSAACDDSAENGSEVEYWGTDDGGSDWRVHLTRS